MNILSNNNDIGMKLRVIGKMIEGGLTNENDVKKADMRIILELPNVTLKELKVITQIQDAVKHNRLYSYLSGEGESNNQERTEHERIAE